MSETGCLTSGSLNSLTVKSKITTNELFNNHGSRIEKHVHQDQNGDELVNKNIINTKLKSESMIPSVITDVSDIIYSSGDTTTNDPSHFIKNAIPKTNTDAITKNIELPNNTIIENIYLRIMNDNFYLSDGESLILEMGVVDNLGTDEGNLEITDEGSSRNCLFVNQSAQQKEITLFACFGTGDNRDPISSSEIANQQINELKTMLSIDTIIPILSDFRLNTKRDRIISNNIGGLTFSADDMDEIQLYYLDSDTPNVTLYNNSGQSKYLICKLYVKELSDSGSDLKCWEQYRDIISYTDGTTRLPAIKEGRGWTVKDHADNRGLYHKTTTSVDSTQEIQNGELHVVVDDQGGQLQLGQTYSDTDGQIEITVQLRKLS